MRLWSVWWSCVGRLRPAFSRSLTFLWFALALAAVCVRPDLAGVTSLVRSLGLMPACYGSLLRLFHSTGFDPHGLARLWTRTALALLQGQASRSPSSRPSIPSAPTPITSGWP